MTEAEFRALLAIEGKELEIEDSYFRTSEWKQKPFKRHVKATIWDTLEDKVYPNIVMSTNWVQRRHYAVQSLIKRYYHDRG